MNALAALRKMSRFQLPDPSLWAVKMVQGAVAAECFGVEFYFTRAEIRCSIYGAPIPNALELLKALLAGTSPKQRHLHHWIVALRSLFGMDLDQWGWSSLVDGEFEEVRIVDGEPHSRSELRELGELHEQPVDTLTVSLERTSSSGPVLSLGTSEYKHLCDLCALCPIPVTADGRLVSQQHPASLVRADFAAVWMEKPTDGRPSFLLDISTEHPRQLKPFLIASKPLADGIGVHPCSRIVTVAPAKGRTPGRAEVFWLRDGALLGPMNLVQAAYGVQLQIICPGDELQMDLSEWGIRKPHGSFPAEDALRTVREMGDHLRPRRSKSVSMDYKTDLPWLSKLGELGLWIAEFLAFLGKSEDKVGLPVDFVDGLDAFGKHSTLSLAPLQHPFEG